MWRDRLRQFLLPGHSEREPGFAQEIQSLSYVGLWVAAITEISVALFLLVARFSLVPNPYTFRLRLIQGGSVVALGLLTLIAAQVRPLYRYSRMLAAVSGFLVTAVLVWFNLRMTLHDPTADDFIPGQITLVLLVGIVAIPFKPIQMLLFGTAVELFYMLAAELVLRWYGAGPGLATLDALFIFMLTLLSTGLTGMLYGQRYSNYAAHLEARRAETQTLLAENAASLGRLAATVSHELNSPLGTLLSSVDTLLLLAARQATSAPEEAQRLVRLQADLRNSAKESAQRLRDLVGRMQRFTNLDKAEVQAADLNELVGDVAALLEPKKKEGSVLTLDLQPVPQVRCRPQQISAVLSSLLSNAVESVNGDGKIEVRTRQRDSVVEVQISDNGRGMSQEQLRSIFDPAFRVENGRVAAGNWSLFSSRQIIREHGGEIRISSKVGVGTKVLFTLPATEGAERASDRPW